VADVGPAGAQPGELLELREADEPVRLALVVGARARPDGLVEVLLVHDPWGYGEPGPDELEHAAG
jgi:hypothetical protein